MSQNGVMENISQHKKIKYYHYPEYWNCVFDETSLMKTTGYNISIQETNDPSIYVLPVSKDTSFTYVGTTYNSNNIKNSPHETIIEMGELDGIIVGVDILRGSIRIKIKDRDTIFICHTNPEMGMRLLKSSGKTLRVSGEGEWRIPDDVNGDFILEHFTIHGFKVLDDMPLSEVVERLRSINSKEWGDDPWADLMRMRGHEVPR